MGFLNPSAMAVWSDATQAVVAFVDEVMARNVLTTGPALILHIRSSGIDVFKSEGQRRGLLLTTMGRPQEAVKSGVERLGADLAGQCALEFDGSLAVVSQMVLPAESPEILSAIVRNKVESIAPWPLAQSLYAHRARPIAGDPSHVAVDIAVVSRLWFEGVAAQLAAADTRVKAAWLRLADDGLLRIGFESEEETRTARDHALRLAKGVATAAALAGAWGLLLAWQASSELADMRTESERLTASLQQTSAEKSTATMLGAANYLHERRLQRLPAVTVVNEVSGLLPNSMWLGRLSIDDDRIELKGQGTDIPSLIEILERSNAFRDVNFASATQLNEQMNSDAFSIDAMLEQANGGALTP